MAPDPEIAIEMPDNETFAACEKPAAHSVGIAGGTSRSLRLGRNGYLSLQQPDELSVAPTVIREKKARNIFIRLLAAASLLLFVALWISTVFPLQFAHKIGTSKLNI
jgi:hypothetical protein